MLFRRMGRTGRFCRKLSGKKYSILVPSELAAFKASYYEALRAGHSRRESAVKAGSKIASTYNEILAASRMMPCCPELSVSVGGTTARI
jgi:hypothetical protein